MDMKHFRSLLLMLLLMLALCVGASAKNECRLYDMTLKTESGEALDHISKGYFWASLCEEDRRSERNDLAGHV